MSVNLLPSEAKFQASKVKFQKRVVRLSQWLVGLWLAAAVVVGGIWLVSRQMYESGKKQLTNTENSYQSLASRLVTNQKLRYKVKLVSKVLGERFEYAKAFRSVQTFLPAESVITRLEIRDESVFRADIGLNGAKLVDDLESRMKSVASGGWPDIKSAKINTLAVDGNYWRAGVEVELK